MGPKDDEDTPTTRGKAILYLLTVNGSKEVAVLQETDDGPISAADAATEAVATLSALLDPHNEEQYALVLGPDILLDDRRG